MESVRYLVIITNFCKYFTTSINQIMYWKILNQCEERWAFSALLILLFSVLTLVMKNWKM